MIDTEKSSRKSFDPAHFSRLYELEARSFWFRGRSDLIDWAFGRYFSSARNFLEIGCGTGYVLNRLHAAYPSLTLSGSELFEEGLDYARQRLGNAATFHQLDATNLPFREEYDAIGAFDVIEHIEDDARVLANLHAALRPGGGLLITVPQHEWLWSDTDVAACHVRRYVRSDLLVKLAAAGFEVLRTTSFVSLLLPAMMLARRRTREGLAEVEAELDLPAALNAIGAATLRVESILIRLGINLPAGGSLLVVARRLPAIG
ncbi:MAG: methyltransferase domain-containing protein [Dokdonella sp.]